MYYGIIVLTLIIESLYLGCTVRVYKMVVHQIVISQVGHSLTIDKCYPVHIIYTLFFLLRWQHIIIFYSLRVFWPPLQYRTHPIYIMYRLISIQLWATPQRFQIIFHAICPFYSGPAVWLFPSSAPTRGRLLKSSGRGGRVYNTPGRN